MYINSERIYSFSIDCLKTAGLKEKDAKIVSDTMLIADARGIHSHGFIRLPIYTERIEKGFINTNAEIKILKENASLTLVDGDYGAGQVVGKKAMEKSIEKAKESGIGVTVVRNSNHFGIAAYYASLATQHNMIGVAISNVEPLMPAIGGAEKIIGNNPISMAAPSTVGQDPLVLDMALSSVPLGKILVSRAKGEAIPQGWGVNSDGESTTDPNDVLNGGFLFPVGGPKGFGLALLTEMLTGVLSGGQYSKTISSMYDLKEKQSISYFMMAIDISFFLTGEEYNKRVEDITSFVKNTKKAPGVTETYLPGEIEFLREKENHSKGIHMDDNVFAELKTLAKKLSIPFNILD